MEDIDSSLSEDIKDLENSFIKKKEKTSCCHSYLTPKGRCYTCPGDDY
ncbi:hypothetical protein HYX12_00750 [Candidatus Woesearchaeota archaeon]|nr:hypothetical protein [Candidatus Woesearchaeota archaeon]